MSKILFAIVTFNEECNISNCINSFKSIADKIVVLDNCSTDKTQELAKEAGAEVIISSKSVKQRIHYLLNEYNLAPYDWVFFIDADERFTVAAKIELKELCDKYSYDTRINGIVVSYQTNFMGKDLKFGGFSKLKKLRCFKPGTAFYENIDLDEHYRLKKGKMIYLKNVLKHMEFHGLNQWILKHNSYAQRASADFIKIVHNKGKIEYSGLERNAKVKRFLKYHFFYKLPSGLRAKLYYWYCLYFKLGFLDGKAGRIFAFLHSYWYRYLIDSYIYEELKK